MVGLESDNKDDAKVQEVKKALASEKIKDYRLYTKSGAWKNSSPGFQFLYTKRQISNIIKV